MAAPAVLSTRDPSAPIPGRGRGSLAAMAVITKPARSAPIAANSATAKASAAAAAVAAGAEAKSGINVKGLSGTLNKGDVHQAMEGQQELFDACIQESRRSVRWVSGAVKYGFRVDAEGRVAELWPLGSTIGHRPLEQCLTMVVANTQFPKPAGRATAEFQWGMAIEPVSERAFEDAKPTAIKRIARKQAKDLFSTCEIKRRRARFRVTAYVAVSGRLMSAGAIPTPPAAEEKVDCVLEQIGKWHMPKLKKASKFTFDVR